MRIEWPWSKALRRIALEHSAMVETREQCEDVLAQCKVLHAKALQCALAAGEAAGVAQGGGVGDRSGRGVDEDLETLDTHREWR